MGMTVNLEDAEMDGAPVGSPFESSELHVKEAKAARSIARSWLREAGDHESCIVTESPRNRAEHTAVVARETAAMVDREAIFPEKAFQSAREQRLLSIMVPTELGGEGVDLSEVLDVCYMLARSCASTAMIFAMHQIMVAILVRHARSNPFHARLLRRISSEQLLLASSTTEGQGGGDLRTSACAVDTHGPRIELTKRATVLSYGTQADVILITARRAADALPSDQVLIAFVKSDYQLEPILNWDALGMRGTCSGGFNFKGEGDCAQIIGVPFQQIQSNTMMPVAHLTWSAVWTGIAAAAVDRARRQIRASTRRSAGTPPPGLVSLSRAQMSLLSLQATVKYALRMFESIANSEKEYDSIDFQNSLNLLKVQASEMATAIVIGSLQACGLAGYRNDGEFSISRQLRDVMSAPVMINNERILVNTAPASMLTEVPDSLFGN
jgi:acyl-CoA dehydrogenase